MKLAWYIHKGLVLPTKSITYPQIYQYWNANTNHGFTNIVLVPVYQKQYILTNKIAELPKYQCKYIIKTRLTMNYPDQISQLQDKATDPTIQTMNQII